MIPREHKERKYKGKPKISRIPAVRGEREHFERGTFQHQERGLVEHAERGSREHRERMVRRHKPRTKYISRV